MFLPLKLLLDQFQDRTGRDLKTAVSTALGHFIRNVDEAMKTAREWMHGETGDRREGGAAARHGEKHPPLNPYVV